MKKVILALLVFSTAFDIWQTWDRINALNPHALAYSARMQVDAPRYFVEGQKMRAAHRFFLPPPSDHSLGMQVLASLWPTWRGQADMYSFKVFNFALWLLTLFLAGHLSARLSNSAAWGLFAVAWLAHSNLFSVYTAVFQPEIIYACGVTLVTYAAFQRLTPLRTFALGLGIAILCVFRVKFLLGIVPLIWYYFADRTKRRDLRFGFFGFFLIAIPWNVVQTVSLEYAYFFEYIFFNRFTNQNNPNAPAFNFPQLPVAEPAGLAFVFQQPLNYLSLLFRRLEYLGGFRYDIWFQESEWTEGLHLLTHWPIAEVRYVMATLGLCTIVLGFFVLMAKRSPSGFGKAMVVASFGMIFLPHLIIGGSTRFVVPLVPLFAILQTLAFQAVYVWGRELRRSRLAVPAWSEAT
jgi:hypothetical protein